MGDIATQCHNITLGTSHPSKTDPTTPCVGPACRKTKARLGGLLAEGSLCEAGAGASFCGSSMHGKKRLHLLYHGSRSRSTVPAVWWSSSSEADVARAGAEAPPALFIVFSVFERPARYFEMLRSCGAASRIRYEVIHVR